MSLVRKIAILLFEDVEVLDFCGPFEVFSVASRQTEPHAFDVVTVAQKSGPILARNGLSVNPRHMLADCPKPDILLVPGGWGTRTEMKNAPLIDWIRETAEGAELVDTGLTDQSVDRLTQDDLLPALKRIVLSQNAFTRGGWERLLFRFGERLEHENGTSPLASYLQRSERLEPEFASYDDEILYDGGRMDTEGKRQLDGEWVEGYDEYDGFDEFDEDGLKHLGGYHDEEQSDSWIGPNREPDHRRDLWEEDEY